MEPWEAAAREAVRDLVARYNAYGDAGRFDDLMELFAPDAAMEIGDGRVYRGRDEIATIFTGTRDRWRTAADDRGAPPYVRHFVSTHQIDLLDPERARGRAYFQVLMAHGLDHWGRYLDEYVLAGGRWRFARRRVRVDGRVPDGETTHHETTTG
ncbi:nuclear transport factor 2 family protein [Actinomadura decatromicini]|uniref:Nuclear transport factor 2 family protein n=1 Tax=Actinomadura decatromicini TaxID=2604572 RepID=A0A5D3F9V8_9ACTN|nr:nuclear transport factor 2 family protein [Actinomadura decatromicini]TYK44470.1 nuclear transport factor 2 family protein [Actinomadura decatromicini]